MGRELITQLLGETWGTAILMLLSTGAITIFEDPWSSGLLFVYLFAYALSICLFVRISGAHFNPAITITAVIARRMEAVTGLLYIIAQLVGSMVGVAIWKGIWNVDDSFKYVINDLVSPLQDGEGHVFGMELMLTYFVVLVWLHAVDMDEKPVGQFRKDWGPFAVGMAYFVALAISGSVDMGCSNPARAFGVSVVAEKFRHHWIFWIGPIIGGIGAYLTHEMFNFLQKGSLKVTP